MKPTHVFIRPVLLVLILAAILISPVLAGGHWETWVVENKSQAPNGDGLYTSIVVDRYNVTHVSWINPSTWEVKYGRFENNRWSVESVGPTASSGFFSYTTSIDIDPDGNPSVSYTNPDGHLIFAHRTNINTWSREDIAGDSEYKVQFSSLKYSHHGEASIAYTKHKGYAFVAGDTQLNLIRKYVARSGPYWADMKVSREIATSFDLSGSGYEPSLGFTRQGRWWIAFRTADPNDGTRPRLKIAREQDSTGWWDTLDGAYAHSGLHPSLAVDSKGDAHIIHTVKIPNDNAGGGLNHCIEYALVSRSSTWITSAEKLVKWVDDSNNPNWYTEYRWMEDPWKSLVLDSTDTPHISYSDNYLEHINGLKYMTIDKSTGLWITRTVDDSGSVGRCNAIAVDISDNPWISYQDNSNSAVKVAHWVP
jgi:hypothetical protein